MEKVSYHNFLAVIIGVLMLITGCLIAYFFQKNLFSQYRGKAQNIMSKKKKS